MSGASRTPPDFADARQGVFTPQKRTTGVAQRNGELRPFAVLRAALGYSLHINLESKYVNIVEIGALGEFVAAVVVSLACLGFQIRQSNALSRPETRQNLMELSLSKLVDEPNHIHGYDRGVNLLGTEDQASRLADRIHEAQRFRVVYAERPGARPFQRRRRVHRRLSEANRCTT